MAKTKKKRPIRSATTRQLTIRLPLDVADTLESVSQDSGSSRAGIIAQALREYFAKEDGDGEA